MSDPTPEERAATISEWWIDAQYSEQWAELREAITEAIRQAEAAAVAREREACMAAECYHCATGTAVTFIQHRSDVTDGMWCHLNDDGGVWGRCGAHAIRARGSERGPAET